MCHLVYGHIIEAFISHLVNRQGTFCPSEARRDPKLPGDVLLCFFKALQMISVDLHKIDALPGQQLLDLPAVQTAVRMALFIPGPILDKFHIRISTA